MNLSDLDQFIRSDRQWRRADRIANYRLMLRQASDEQSKLFWHKALERLGAA